MEHMDGHAMNPAAIIVVERDIVTTSLEPAPVAVKMVS